MLFLLRDSLVELSLLSILCHIVKRQVTKFEVRLLYALSRFIFHRACCTISLLALIYIRVEVRDVVSTVSAVVRGAISILVLYQGLIEDILCLRDDLLVIDHRQGHDNLSYLLGLWIKLLNFILIHMHDSTDIQIVLPVNLLLLFHLLLDFVQVDTHLGDDGITLHGHVDLVLVLKLGQCLV